MGKVMLICRSKVLASVTISRQMDDSLESMLKSDARQCSVSSKRDATWFRLHSFHISSNARDLFKSYSIAVYIELLWGQDRYVIIKVELQIF